jgi:hypothetical protein
MSDWERQNQDRLRRDAVGRETLPAFPPYPREADLAAFAVPAVAGFRFHIDRASLAVDDGVVRYALVVRSAEGADTTSYEALRCAGSEYRAYALGRAGAWQAASGGWRPIAQRWHLVLAREYFCPQGVLIRDAAEGRRALEQGGHPFHRGFSGDDSRR